jgi:hypothetical protein
MATSSKFLYSDIGRVLDRTSKRFIPLSNGPQDLFYKTPDMLLLMNFAVSLGMLAQLPSKALWLHQTLIGTDSSDHRGLPSRCHLLGGFFLEIRIWGHIALGFWLYYLFYFYRLKMHFRGRKNSVRHYCTGCPGLVLLWENFQ